MANYANAKATIAANIYTNHTGQVTAEMVKTAANEIVNTLIAGGYLYAGIAHPGDAAVSPDANVFYLASEAGTYTNFVGAGGSLVVADGEVAVLKYNGSWSKEVTGAATAAQVAELGQNLELAFCGENLLSIDGKFIYLNGNINSGAGWSVSDYIPVSNGDVFLISVGGGNNNTRPAIICDANKNVLEIINYNNQPNYFYVGRLVINNASAKYIVFSSKNDYASNFYKFSQLDKMYFERAQQDRNTFIKTDSIAKNVASLQFGTNRPSYLITYKDAELFAENKYMRNDGTLVDFAGTSVYKFVPPTGTIGCAANSHLGVTSGIYGAIQIGDDSFIPLYPKTKYPAAPILGLSKNGIKAIYFNVESDNNGNVTNLADSIEYYFADRSYNVNGREYLDCNNIVEIDGYMNNGAKITLRGYFVAKIPYDKSFDYFGESLTVAGCLYDINDNFLGNVSDYIVPWSAGSPGKNLFPIGTAYMLVTCPREWYRVPKKNVYSRIHTYVQRPFDFSGKSAVFFGDSITRGFASVPGGSQFVTENNWPNLLCQKLNMTAVNKAIGGSALTYRDDETYASGVKLIAGPSGTRYDIVEDFIFIGHGSNDWTSNIPIGKVTDNPASYEDATTFYGALNLVASTIKSLYPNKPVIFVLPIWRAEYGNFDYSLDDYRMAICDVAFRNNFNVVNGKEFGFECGSDLTIADKTHPTEMGYQIYANQMYDRLV